MNKTLKKQISITLIAALLISNAGITSFADSVDKIPTTNRNVGGGFYYEENTSKVDSTTSDTDGTYLNYEDEAEDDNSNSKGTNKNNAGNRVNSNVNSSNLSSGTANNNDSNINNANNTANNNTATNNNNINHDTKTNSNNEEHNQNNDSNNNSTNDIDKTGNTITDNTKTENNNKTINSSIDSELSSENNLQININSNPKDASENSNTEVSTDHTYNNIPNANDTTNTNTNTNTTTNITTSTSSNLSNNVSDITRTYTESQDNLSESTATKSDIAENTLKNISTKSTISLEEINLSTKSTTNTFGSAPIANDYIWYGLYPQNDETGTLLEPIKWKVLSQNGTEAFLLSDYLLDIQPYCTSATTATWETSDVRAWLNSDFYNRAFSTNQKLGVKEKLIGNNDNPVYHTSGGNNTRDKIFLLSIYELENYFPNANSRIHQWTFYVGFCRGYFLRSPGDTQSHVTWVNNHNNGQLEYNNSLGNGGIVPAMYVDLTSDIFKSSNNNVTWNLNGGAFNLGSSRWNQYLNYQGGQTLPLNANLIPPMPLATLKRWELNGASVSEIPVNQTGDITLTAIWQFPPKYNVVYNANIDNATGTMQNDNDIYSGVNHTLQNNAYSRRAYNFLGWCDNQAKANPSQWKSDGPGHYWVDGDTTFNYTVANDGDNVNLYAVWQEIVYPPYEDKSSSGDVGGPSYDTSGNISAPGGGRKNNLDYQSDYKDSSNYVRVFDVYGNSGFGRWLRKPDTKIWYFEIISTESLIKEKISNKTFLRNDLNIYQINGVGSGFTPYRTAYGHYSQYSDVNKEIASVNLLTDGWYRAMWKGQDEWYHFDKNGVMQLGWFQENNKIYYLEQDFSSDWYGRSVQGKWTIDGISYNFDKTGALIP